MLVLYVVALGLGGTLLAASLVLGGDHEGDVDGGAPELSADADADAGGADVDHEVDHAIGAHDTDDAGHAAFDAVTSWLPFASVRFWTFFLAFFGLTGTTLVVGDLSHNQPLIAGLSIGVGYLSGMSIVTVLRRLRSQRADSNLDREDYIGATGTVVLRVAKGHTGKIRLELKGRIVELIADTEEEPVSFEIKDRVMVYGITEDGRAIVTRTEEADA